MRFQKRRYRHRIAAVALHPHRQRLQPLHQLPGVERCKRRAEDPHHFHARLHRVSEIAEGLEKAHAVIARRGFVHRRKPAVSPGEFAAFDHHAAHGRAVSAHEFGGGVHDDIRAVLQRLAKVR